MKRAGSVLTRFQPASNPLLHEKNETSYNRANPFPARFVLALFNNQNIEKDDRSIS